jgi:hypothetical protein
MRVPWYLRKLLPSIALIRVSFFLTCVALVFALLAARAAKADIGELGLAAGRQLDHLQDLTADAETLLINGAELSRATQYTPDAVSNVLDRVEDACMRNPGLLGQAMREVPADALAKVRADEELPRSTRNAIIRDEGGDGGMVICFVGAKPSSLRELGARLEHFLQTLELYELGELRYVYAVRKGDRTRVTTLWATGSVNLKRMFPEQGDAAGSDSALAPRPPNARRTFTASAAGQTSGLRMYESREGLAELDAFYGAEMQRRGFRVPEGAKQDGTTAFNHPDGQQVFVSTARIDDKSYVTLTETGSGVSSITAEVN